MPSGSNGSWIGDPAIAGAVAVATAIVSLAGCFTTSEAIAVDYVQDVRPLFEKHCVACHGPKNAKGNYRLDNYELALGAGDSGTAAFATVLEPLPAVWPKWVRQAL